MNHFLLQQSHCFTVSAPAAIQPCVYRQWQRNGTERGREYHLDRRQPDHRRPELFNDRQRQRRIDGDDFQSAGSGSGGARLIRNWKVANTNTVGPVNLSFDFTGLTVTGTIGTPGDFRLMVNTAGDPTFATGTTAFYGPSFTGNVATFSNTKLPDQAVFAILSNAAAGTPLPVIFVSFMAQPAGNNVDLNWVVGDNSQASSYEINQSTDGVHFTSIGEVANVADQQAYSFVQMNAGPGQHYYQVLETDLDGKAMYSNIVSATIAAGDFSVTVLNNPATGNTDAQLQINATTPGTALIELWTTGGARISLQQQAIGTGVNTVSIPARLS